ncbi:MAG TPA: hypothetical protein ENN81_07540, partial [Phycisphaerales bacterium]|nr:hypothetical protein [Phycisphaerales bacterium]
MHCSCARLAGLRGRHEPLCGRRAIPQPRVVRVGRWVYRRGQRVSWQGQRAVRRQSDRAAKTQRAAILKGNHPRDAILYNLCDPVEENAMTSYLKHLTVTFIVVLFVAADGSAAPGTLSDKDIERMQSSLKMDPQMRAMYNALTNTDISSLALNREIVRGHNELYSHKIEVKGITNQKSSGRCWLFAGLNVIRPKVIDKHKLKGFEFSQTYLAFWDKMEKANVTLELIIEMRDRDLMDREMEFVLRHPCDDGGYWESVVNLIEKYGAVPQGVMPETNSSSSTGLMNSLLSRKLRADAVKLREMHAAGEPLKKLRAAKKKMLAEVYRMLVLNLGEPPRQFEWRHEDPNSKPTAPKSYTPR